MASRTPRLRRPTPVQVPEQQSRAKWTAPLTKILVDLTVEHILMGKKRKNTFGKKAWTAISEDFYQRTGFKWDHEQLKNRVAVLRRQYSIVKLLLDQADFVMDESTGVISGTDEAWDKFIKDHPDAETVRTAGCPIYKQLSTIFSEAGTISEHNNGSIKQEVHFPEPVSMFQQEPSPSSESDDTPVELDTKPNKKIKVGPGPGKRGKGIDASIANAVRELAAASTMRAAAEKQLSERFSISECVRALDAMKGVDEKVYFGAVDLFDNRNARETFLSLKADKRLAWLTSKCSSSGLSSS